MDDKKFVFTWLNPLKGRDILIAYIGKNHPVVAEEQVEGLAVGGEIDHPDAGKSDGALITGSIRNRQQIDSDSRGDHRHRQNLSPLDGEGFAQHRLHSCRIDDGNGPKTIQYTYIWAYFSPLEGLGNNLRAHRYTQGAMGGCIEEAYLGVSGAGDRRLGENLRRRDDLRGHYLWRHPLGRRAA